MSETTFEVHFQHKDCERRLIVAPGETHLMGRSADASFFLSHGSVSRRHCQIVGHEQGIELQDLGSRNGCFYNGYRIDRVFLANHCLIQVGRLAFSVWIKPRSSLRGRCEDCKGSLKTNELHAHNSSKRVLCDRCEEMELAKSHKAIDIFLDSEGFQPGRKLTDCPYSFITSHPELEQDFRVSAIPLPSYDNSREFDRFRKEVRLVAELEHPGLLRLLDVRSANDILYVLTENCDGLSLRDFMKEHGPLGLSKALAAVRALLDTLAYTSEQKIYHHMLTPDFVYFSHEGEVRILDVRISQHFAVMSAMGHLDPEQGGFRAPELFLGLLDADIRSDLYSVGALFHFMLTGKAPYENSTSVSIARAAMLNVPLLPSIEGIPPALHRWLKTVLSFDPAERPASVAEAQRLLDKSAMNALMPGHESNHGTESRDELLGAFSGSFLGPQLLEILELLETHKKSGILEVMDDDGGASTRLVLEEGIVIDARCGSCEGSDALKGLLCLRHGSYYFDPRRSGEHFPKGVGTWTISTLLVETHHEGSSTSSSLFPSREI